MRTKFFAIAVCLLGGVVSTHAQAGGLKVNVPFDFEVANKTLSAGEYVIWSQRELVMLRASSGIIVAKVQANRTLHDVGQSGKVVFNCYQNRCFLSQLWTPEAERAREIVKSKNEREISRRSEAVEFALLGVPR